VEGSEGLVNYELSSRTQTLNHAYTGGRRRWREPIKNLTVPFAERNSRFSIMEYPVSVPFSLYTPNPLAAPTSPPPLGLEAVSASLEETRRWKDTETEGHSSRYWIV